MLLEEDILVMMIKVFWIPVKDLTLIIMNGKYCLN